MKHYVIPLRPIAWARTAFYLGRRITPKNYRDFKTEIRNWAVNIGEMSCLYGPLSIELRFNFKKPKTVQRQYPSVVPDLDNLVKAIWDSLNGVAWADDAQIVELSASKIYNRENFIELGISQIGEPEMPKKKKKKKGSPY